MMKLFPAISLFLLAGTAAAQQELFVHSSAGVIYRIDNYATQPSAVAIGTAGLPSTDVPQDMAVDPVSGDFFFTVYPNGTVSGSYTYRVDPNTFVATRVGGFQLFGLKSLEFSSDGKLFGNGGFLFSFVRIGIPNGFHYFLESQFDAQPAGDLASDLDGKFLVTTVLGDLESHDPTSGVTVNLGPHGLGPSAYGLEIDTDGTIYILRGNGDVFTYDRTTSVATLVGSTGVQVIGAAFKIPAGPPAGDVYGDCQNSVPNSTGNLGQISFSGSTVAADNNVTITATDVPPNTFGIFLTSPFGRINGSGNPIGPSDGNYCLGGSPPGVFRAPGQIQRSDLMGQFSLDVDLTTLPANTGISSVIPGERLRFQGWFRDSGPQGSNYTNAVMVIFS